MRTVAARLNPSSQPSVFSGVAWRQPWPVRPGGAREADRFEPRRTRPAAVLFAGGRQVKVMSYNAQNLNRGKTQESMAALAEAIRLEDPDIIAFQEVESTNVLEELNLYFLDNTYPQVVFPPQQPDNNVRQAFLVKGDIRVIDSAAHMEEQNRGGREKKRGFVEATFETPAGFRFRVYNAHFRAVKPDPETARRVRMEEAQTAAEILRRALTEKPDEPFLVMGDFNSQPDTHEGRAVLDTLSLKKDRDKQNDLIQTIHAPKNEDSPVSTKGGHWLDLIFASASMVPHLVRSYIAGHNFQEPWFSASDHIPAVAILEETPEAKASSQPTEAQPVELLPARPRLDRIA